MNPGFVSARKNLAIAYFNEGQYDPATTEFQRLARVPGTTEQIANLFLGMINEKKSEYARAVSFFARSGTLMKEYPEALLSFANAEWQLKGEAKAEAALKTLVEAPGLTAEEHLKASQLASQMGQDDLALAEVEKAKKQGGDLEGLEYQYALALDRAGRSKESLEILKEMASGKADADALNLLSHVARENNEFALALDSLRQAAKLAPERRELSGFQHILRGLRKLSACAGSRRSRPGTHPELLPIAGAEGSGPRESGRLSEAEDVLGKAGEQQKDNSLALLCLAIVQTHAGKLQEAERTLTAAIHGFPSNYYMHYHLGIVLVEMQGGKPRNPETQAKAKHAFQEAIRLNPGFADSYYQLAKLYSENSPKTRGQNLVACLRADPNHASAEHMLARLYLSAGRKAEAQELIDRFEGLRQAAKSKEMQQPRIESIPR